jgi:hypothetical protein
LFYRKNFFLLQDIDLLIENNEKSDLLSESLIVQQLVGQFEEVFLTCVQMRWSHNSAIIEKIKNPKEVN